jgi:CRP-like cAMP-binding protein
MPSPIAIVPSRAFKAGDVVFRQGEPTVGEAYLVHDGKVELRRMVDGVERRIRTLGQGELLGEVALFRAGPHSATAVAAERVTLLVLAADQLEELIRAHPDLAMAIIRQLARMAAGEPGGAMPARPARRARDSKKP